MSRSVESFEARVCDNRCRRSSGSGVYAFIRDLLSIVAQPKESSTEFQVRSWYNVTLLEGRALGHSMGRALAPWLLEQVRTFDAIYSRLSRP